MFLLTGAVSISGLLLRSLALYPLGEGVHEQGCAVRDAWWAWESRWIETLITIIHII